jgi:hypothetical protein
MLGPLDTNKMYAFLLQGHADLRRIKNENGIVDRPDISRTYAACNGEFCR